MVRSLYINPFLKNVLAIPLQISIFCYRRTDNSDSLIV